MWPGELEVRWPVRKKARSLGSASDWSVRFSISSIDGVCFLALLLLLLIGRCYLDNY